MDSFWFVAKQVVKALNQNQIHSFTLSVYLSYAMFCFDPMFVKHNPSCIEKYMSFQSTLKKIKFITTIDESQ